MQDYQWTVIDGGSNDGTPEFLQQQDCEWVSEPDEGIYDAMNKGIERAHGEYTIFMNAGDVFASPNVLAMLVRKIGQAPDFIYGDALETDKCKTARPYNEYLWGMITHHQAMLYKTRLLKELRYDQQWRIAADYDLTCRFLQNCSKASYVSELICVFEAGGVSQQQQKQGRLEQYRIRKKLGLCSPVYNAWIYSIQSISATLRKIAPSIYWPLKNTLTQRAHSRYNPRTKEIKSLSADDGLS